MNRRGALLLAVIGSLFSCQAPPPVDQSGLDAGQRQLNHGYAMLHTLVSKQSNVDKALFMKSVSPQTTAIIRHIAEVSQQARDRLKAFAEEDGALVLDDRGLPDVEAATRDSIEKILTRKFIFGGPTFERDLLIAQVSGTEYGWHLAAVLAENDENETRSAWLQEFSANYQQLYDQCLARLQTRPTGSESTNE